MRIEAGIRKWIVDRVIYEYRLYQNFLDVLFPAINTCYRSTVFKLDRIKIFLFVYLSVVVFAP